MHTTTHPMGCRCKQCMGTTHPTGCQCTACTVHLLGPVASTAATLRAAHAAHVAAMRAALHAGASQRRVAKASGHISHTQVARVLAGQQGGKWAGLR
ncbi:MAG: hypothetical protein LC674_01450 [Actinobacteria bacterium]|nr:hypothetical protein [Actinomycetota bacterium]